MRWFKNRKTRTKFFVSFGLLIALVTAVAMAGYQGIKTINQLLEALYGQHFQVAVSLAETGSNLNAVRATLLGMMAAKDRDAQEKLHAQIRELTKEIDGEFGRLLGLGLDEKRKAGLREVRSVWEEFRNTRDSQLIPAIYEGRLDEARALATGIQAERFRKFSSGAREMISGAEEAARQFKEESARRYASSAATFLGISGFAVFLGIATAFFLARIIARPLGEVAGALQRVAAGDLTVTVEVESKDEVGQVAEATRKMVEGLREVMVQVNAGATHVAGAAQQMSAGAEELSNGAQEQASSLEETASSMEQMASTIKQTADNARQANQLALSSRDVADKGGRVVDDAVGAMGEINKASKQIADIISVIDEIAFQTNLLALNAAVEAARAGEQGRGFAVVASEVRSLAQRAATSAKEIKKLIQDSVQKVQNGSELVTQSGKTLEEIVASVKRVAEIVSEIAAASQEQAAGIDQVNKAITQMDQVTQSNAAQVEELSSTSQSMAAQAEQLQALIKRFKIEEGREAAVRTAAPVHAYAASTPSAPTPKAEVIGRRARPKVPAKKAEPALVGSLAGNGKGDGDGFEEF